MSVSRAVKTVAGKSASGRPDRAFDASRASEEALWPDPWCCVMTSRTAQADDPGTRHRRVRWRCSAMGRVRAAEPPGAPPWAGTGPIVERQGRGVPHRWRDAAAAGGRPRYPTPRPTCGTWGCAGPRRHRRQARYGRHEKTAKGRIQFLEFCRYASTARTTVARPRSASRSCWTTSKLAPTCHRQKGDCRRARQDWASTPTTAPAGLHPDTTRHGSTGHRSPLPAALRYFMRERAATEGGYSTPTDIAEQASIIRRRYIRTVAQQRTPPTKHSTKSSTAQTFCRRRGRVTSPRR